MRGGFSCALPMTSRRRILHSAGTAASGEHWLQCKQFRGGVGLSPPASLQRCCRTSAVESWSCGSGMGQQGCRRLPALGLRV